jgi:3-deoxy-D-arabino-heptulosonate 7-phosphate (DAHP) synthase class II
MASSLFLVGEIGGNDYNQALFQGRSVDEVKTYVPDIVAGISSAVTVRRDPNRTTQKFSQASASM